MRWQRPGEMEGRTLHVLEAPDTRNTVTDAFGKTNHSAVRQTGVLNALHSLRTRPVSSTFAPTEEPAMRDSRIEETSDAAARDVSRVPRRKGASRW